MAIKLNSFTVTLSSDECNVRGYANFVLQAQTGKVK